MKIHIDEDKPVVGEGRYKARFIKHEASISGKGTNTGTRLTFQILSKEFKGENVAGMIWMRKDEDGEYHMFERDAGYKLLLGLNKGNDIADMKFKPLYDEVYWIEVVHKKNADGDRTFANIIEIEPYEKEEATEKVTEKQVETKKKKVDDDNDFKDDGDSKKQSKNKPKDENAEEEISDKELEDDDE